jgi:hypothetical protein
VATAINVTTFRTALGECADAIELKDYTTAETKLLKASTILAGLELEKGSQGSVVKWRQNLVDLREQLDKARQQMNATTDRRRIRGRTNYS